MIQRPFCMSKTFIFLNVQNSQCHVKGKQLFPYTPNYHNLLDFQKFLDQSIQLRCNLISLWITFLAEMKID